MATSSTPFPAGAIDAIPSMLAAINVDGTVGATNAAWRRAFGGFGLDRSEFDVGADVWKLIELTAARFGDQDAVPRIIEAIKRAMAQEEFVPDVAFARNQGEVRQTWRLVVHPIAGGAGSFVAMITETTTASELAERMANAGSVDSVTGLPQPERWLDELSSLIRSMPAPGSLAVVVVELLGFERVQSLLGLPKVREAVAVVAFRLDGLDGRNLMSTRLAPYRFALTVEQADDGGRRMADFVRRACEVEVIIGTLALKIPVAVGVAANVSPFDLPASLLERATTAMADDAALRPTAVTTIRRLDSDVTY